MYQEEADFLHRAAQKGLPIYYCPFTHIYHRSGYGTLDSPLKKVFWIRRNAIYFLRKHRASPGRWSYYFMTLALSLLYNLILLRWRKAATIGRAVREGFHHS